MPTTPPRFLCRLSMSILVLALCVVAAGCDSSTDPGDDPDPRPPVAPSGLEAASGDSQVALSWGSVSDVDAYTVYRATEPISRDVSNATAVESGLSAADFTDTSVENGTLYYYRVTATANELESNGSNQVDVTPFSPPPSDRP